jgi:hypothetical protein
MTSIFVLIAVMVMLGAGMVLGFLVWAWQLSDWAEE